MAWGQKPAPIKQFPAATKRFVNQTGGYLQVTLVVRSGDDPKKPPFKSVSFELNEGQTIVQQYGDQSNPYLNNIVVVLTIQGSIPERQNLVIARGSPVDNDYNTHDTMVFLYKSSAILMEVRNQGAGIGERMAVAVAGTGGPAEPRRYEFAKPS